MRERIGAPHRGDGSSLRAVPPGGVLARGGRNAEAVPREVRAARLPRAEKFTQGIVRHHARRSAGTAARFAEPLCSGLRGTDIAYDCNASFAGATRLGTAGGVPPPARTEQ